ncbi:MAG: DUF6763 family protein [Pseudomonadota bacterium]
MANAQLIEPVVGDWYRSHGLLFEVVAVDDGERLVEIQHADGDLEEIEIEDWATRCRAGSLANAEAPEDLRTSMDSEQEDETGQFSQAFDELRGLRAEALGDLDLFD